VGVALLDDLENVKESISVEGVGGISTSGRVALELAKKSGIAGGIEESVYRDSSSSKDPRPPPLVEERRLPRSEGANDDLRPKDGLRSRSLLSGTASGSRLVELAACLDFVILAIEPVFECLRLSSLPFPLPLLLPLPPHIGVVKKGGAFWLEAKLDFCIMLAIEISRFSACPPRL